MTELQKQLFSMQDAKYRDFHARLMPTIDKSAIIGVRTPDLRRFAKQFSKTDEARAFMCNLPHKYYEENNLHAFMIEGIKDFDECMRELERFLPYVDNWATCDAMSPKVFKKYPAELESKIFEWIKSGDTYTVRFAIKTLMSLYLEDNFKESHLELVAGVKSDEYYINMASAWYFATALAKQFEKTLPYIAEKKLPPEVHNKTIRKACESYRISDAEKEKLKKMRN